MKKTNRRFFIVLVLFLLVSSSTQAFQTEPTTLIFVRHAEKVDDGTRNPPLSAEGKERAVNLYHTLSDYTIKAIYSTAYKRTKMTAQPIADSLGLDIQEYGFDEISDFLTQIIEENSGYTVLIVGHSNTTPSLTNMVLGTKEFEQIEESKYGDIFIVKTSEFGNGEVTLKEF
tara:strand:- start:10349 stop:10864 length:516 start_codon:yes stop_codon:yes gene_type:complete